MRNEKFFALDALNRRIFVLLGELNDRPMKLYGASRRELFESLDRPALTALPARRFVYAEWKHAKVSIDYHVAVDHHSYSVPYQVVGEQVDVRFSATTVEVFLRQKRLAAHQRSHARGKFTTVPEHMPKAHREHMEWSPTRLVSWAETVGPQAAALVTSILKSRPHPEQGYRSCIGILRLGKRYGEERLEKACERALRAGARSYRHVDSILKNGLDRLPLEDPDDPKPLLPAHENVRGGDYYKE
jgi:transposase